MVVLFLRCFLHILDNSKDLCPAYRGMFDCFPGKNIGF